MVYIVKYGTKGKMSSWIGVNGKVQKFRTKASANALIKKEKTGLFGPFTKGWVWKVVKIK